MALLLLIFAFLNDSAPDMARIHVVANSDSKRDISVKMKVAESVAELLGEENFDSLEDMGTALEGKAEEIRALADSILSSEGMDYSSRVEVGIRHFDRRTLGNSAIPEGDYLALTVTLGNGMGHNWWSVMYPDVSFKASLSMGEEGGVSKTVLVGGNTIVKIRCLILDLFYFFIDKEVK